MYWRRVPLLPYYPCHLSLLFPFFLFLVFPARSAARSAEPRSARPGPTAQGSLREARRSAPRSAREKPKKEKKEKGERGDKGSKGEGDLDSTYNVFCCFGVVASVAGKFRGVSRFNFGVPFREFRGDSASRVLISACLSAYPGCQKSAFPRIQGARNQRLQGARNQRCGVYFGLAPRVGVERVQLFVGVGASSWCNFFRLWSPRRPLRRAFFFLAVFSGARRWWVLLLVVVLVGWL